MKRLLTLFTISILTLTILNSCESGEINQETLFRENNPDLIGKYFYNIFKHSKKEKFVKWMYNHTYSNWFWDDTQNYNNGLFKWNKTEYENCIIDKKYENEYFVTVYFKDAESNETYKIRFLLMRALLDKSNDNKYYLSTSYAPIIRRSKRP